MIADLSYNYLERKVLQRGHWLDAPRNDYGIDAVMFHHNRRGEVENGEVRFQLKATRRLTISRRRDWISQTVEIKDLRYWYFEPYPVIIIVYDAERSHAFWLHVQDYVDTTPGLLESDSNTIALRIPTRNKLNLRSVDYFRKLSLETLAKFHNQRRGG